MKSFKQFNEAMSNVWGEAARKLRKVHPPLANDLANMNLKHAAQAYRGSPPDIKGHVDAALKAHSHYHDIHAEFHTHVQSLAPPKKAEAAPGKHLPSTKDHFIDHAMKYFGYSVLKDKSGDHRDQFRHHHREIDNYYGMKKGAHMNPIHDQILDTAKSHWDVTDGTMKAKTSTPLDSFKEEIGDLYDFHKRNNNFMRPQEG